VSVIVVSWNVLPLLRQCLESLIDEPDVREVVVVDNASTDGTCEEIENRFPAVKLLCSRENLGYAGGINAGAKLAGGDYFLFLNPDTRLMPGAIATMLRVLEHDGTVAVVAPRLELPDGSIQPSRRRFPSLATLLVESTPMQRNWVFRRLMRRFYCLDRVASHAQEVDWAEGACLLVRAEALAETGGMDQGFFMYSEEVDLCRRLKQLAWRVVYEPSARVVHYHGRSSEQAPRATLVRFHRSKVLYALKHFGKLVSGLLRVRLLAMFAWGTVVEAMKWLAGHKRDLRRERVRSYLEVLASGLRV